MPISSQGFIKIYPSTVQIISGEFALNSDAVPQPSRSVTDIEAYFDARVANLAIAPDIRRATEYPAASGVYVPAIGEYELQFSPSSIAIEFYDAYPGVPTATLDFLDADFPMGMGISQPQLNWTGQGYFGPERDRTINNLKFRYFGSTIETYTPGTGLLTGNHLTPSDAIISNPFANWSFIQVMKPFGLRINVEAVVSASLNTPRQVISEFFILAAYNINTFATSTTTPDALPGNDIRVESAVGNFDNLDPDEFKFYWDTQEGEEDVNPLFPGWTGGVRVPRNLIFEFTQFVIELRIPGDLGIPYGGRRLMLTGTGNSFFFSGEYPLQNFNITLVDGSGLYKLIENQRHDTYYDRDATPVEEINLKIPDPNIRTGGFNVEK